MKSRIPFTFGWIAATLLLTHLSALAASGPELTVQGPRGEKARLAIESIETEVFFFQDLAETTVTINFRNPEDRIIEGEFAIPLPPGATISTYALDVNGTMRDGVVVEKERARHAYESIKRQMIDPGFVEREAGNTYRTKIFPIPAKGTKAVKIGYCEILPAKNGKIIYQLPLTEGVPVKSLHFSLEHIDDEKLTFTSSGGLSFKADNFGIYHAKGQNITPGKELIVSYQEPTAPVITTGGNYSYLRGTIPQELQKTRPRNPKKLELFWDCSESGRLRNHEKEFKLLDAYFKKIKNVEVQLKLVHLTCDPAGSFAIKNGDWKMLRKKLSNLLYDGATNLASINPTGDLNLIFTDGRSSLPAATDAWKHPAVLIDSLGIAPNSWSHSATSSGGSLINLKSTPIGDALATLSNGSFTILGNEPPIIDGSLVRIFRFKNQKPNLTWNTGGSTPNTFPIPVSTTTNPRVIKMIQKIWAQQTLQKLEEQLPANRTKVIAHCKEHGLVSDETSLIVLDRFSDYVRYQIPPPEKDLRERYTRELELKKSRTVTRLVRQWEKRVYWHTKNFPWHDHVLAPDVHRIAIWQKALDTAFEQKDLDQNAVSTITRWKDQAIELRKKRLILEDQKNYEKWMAELADLIKEKRKLGQTLPTVPADQKQIAVSLRGMVHNPGTFKIHRDLTLRKALAKAGGIHSAGTASGIAVYRNAKKTIYNTLSIKYQDIKLLPGDMVVVLEKGWNDYYSDHGDADPFGESVSEPIDPTSLPAIIEVNEDFTQGSFGSADSDPFAGGGDSGSLPTKTNLQGSLALQKTPQTNSKALEQFAKSLDDGTDPITAYQKLRSAPRYDDTFYLSASTILADKGQASLARRVLSNLVEDGKPRAANFRTWAFALAKLEDWKNAHSVILQASKFFPNDQLLALDQAWIARRGEVGNPTPSLLTAAVAHAASDTVAEIAAAYLTISAEGRKALDNPKINKPLPANLRIVITNASGLRANYEIIDPIDFTNPYPGNWQQISPIGGRFIQRNGVGEFAIKNPIPGDYQFSLLSTQPDILRLEIYWNWGQKNQTLEEHIIPVTGKPLRQDLFTYTLKFQE